MEFPAWTWYDSLIQWFDCLPPIPPELGAVVFSGVVETLCPSLPLLCHGAPLPWTIARMRCRSSGDRLGQAAMTALSDGPSGTNWALMDGERVVGGRSSDGEWVVGLSWSGPLTTPDRGLFAGLAESSGSESERAGCPRSQGIKGPAGVPGPAWPAGHAPCSAGDFRALCHSVSPPPAARAAERASRRDPGPTEPWSGCGNSVPDGLR